jgi:hypothetical protein
LLACGCSLDKAGGASPADDVDMDASHIGGANGDGGLIDADDQPDTDDGEPDDGGTPGDDGTPDDDSTPDDGDVTGDGDGEPSLDAGEPDSGGPPADQDSGPPPSFTPDPGHVGAPCTEDNECMGPALSNPVCATERDNITLPGGYCTHGCLATCGANELCTENFCVRTCDGNADCRAAEGYECRNHVCTLPGL